MHIHFGLERFGPNALYFGAIISFLLSVFYRPTAGLYFVVPMLPLQTARYRLISYPFGAQFIDFCLLGVMLGLLMRRQLSFKTPLTKLLVVIGIFTYGSLWWGSISQGLPVPLWFSDTRMSNWKNFMVLPYLFILVVSAIRTKAQMRTLLLVMCLGVLILNRQFKNNSIDSRDFSSFSYVGREGGNMGYAGVNGLAAFEVQFCLFIWALTLAEKSIIVKMGGWIVAGFCLYCLMFSFSRGGYVAFVIGFLYLAVAKQRILLVFFVGFLFTWKVLVPNAVVERVTMTYEGDAHGGSEELDHSAQLRVMLWEDAVELVKEHFALGAGFNTYEFMGRDKELHDTHNLYMKFLVEYGVTGFFLFLGLFFSFFGLAWRLHNRAPDPFLKAIGFGFSAYVLCLIIVNFFGDRWNYVQISGYTWVLAAFVVRGLQMVEEQKAIAAEGESKPVVLMPAWAPAHARMM